MTKLKALLIALITVPMVLLAGCSSPADKASYNLSKDADDFKIDRRIVFYNGITGEYILGVTGKCSLGNNDSEGQLTVTCKDNNGQFVKHFLGLSDNVTYFAEQTDPADVSASRYKVYFTPEELIPDINRADTK